MRHFLLPSLLVLLVASAAHANFCFQFTTEYGVNQYGENAYWDFAGGDVISLVDVQDQVSFRIACPEMPGATMIDCYPLGVNGTSLTITKNVGPNPGVYPVYTTEITQAYVQAAPTIGYTFFYLGVPSAQISPAFLPETLWFYGAIHTPSIPTTTDGLVTLDMTSIELSMGMRSSGVSYDYSSTGGMYNRSLINFFFRLQVLI